MWRGLLIVLGIGAAVVLTGAMFHRQVLSALSGGYAHADRYAAGAGLVGAGREFRIWIEDYESGFVTGYRVTPETVTQYDIPSNNAAVSQTITTADAGQLLVQASALRAYGGQSWDCQALDGGLVVIDSRIEDRFVVIAANPWSCSDGRSRIVAELLELVAASVPPRQPN